MSGSQISIVSKSGNSIVVDFPQAPSVLTGYFDADGASQITRGGTPFTITHRVFQSYTAEWYGINRVTYSPFFAQFHQFLNQALKGEPFSLAIDSSLIYDENLTADAAVAAATFSLPATVPTGLVGKFVILEHVTDPDLSMVFKVTSRTATTVTTTDTNAPDAYPTGSRMRTLEFFPTCLMTTKQSPITQRPANRGSNLWDISLPFRAVTP